MKHLYYSVPTPSYYLGMISTARMDCICCNKKKANIKIELQFYYEEIHQPLGILLELIQYQLGITMEAKSKRKLPFRSRLF